MATKTLQSIDDAQAEFVEGGDFAAVGEDILPATDALHSLGSAALRWVNVRAQGQVFAGDTIAGPYALLASGSLEIYDSSLVQRVAFSESAFWIADAAALRVLEYDSPALKIRDGDAVTEYALDHIELQDAGGGTAFRVELGGTLIVRLPGLPTADPVSAGQVWNDSGTLKVSAGA